VRLRRPLLTLIWLPNTLQQPRLGLTIAKKSLKASVQRNRLKRLIREYFRTHQQSLPHGDLVFIGQTGLARAPQSEWKAAIDELCRDLIRRCAPSSSP